MAAVAERSTGRLMLDRSKRVVIGGAGPFGLTAALSLVEALGENAPHITLVEPCSIDSCEKWEPCKGCAGGVLRGTIEHLAARFDHRGAVGFSEEGISLETSSGKKYLSRTCIDQVAFHLPGELGVMPPTVRLADSDVIVPTFRIGGPRYIHDDWVAAGHIGFSPFLYQLLTTSTSFLELVPGRIRLVDTGGERPVVEVHTHEGTLKITADYVLLTTGMSKVKPPAIKRAGVVHEIPRVDALKTSMLSLEVPINPVTRDIFNIGAGLHTHLRSHLFMTSGPAHYILAMPKVIGPRVALTVATFGVEGHSDLEPDDVVSYLSAHPILRRSGIEFDIHEAYCHCAAFIPNSTLDADEQYGPGYSLAGDVVGGLRLWKNGIGTAIAEAERLAAHLARDGYGQESLAAYAQSCRARLVEDNQTGRLLLKWVDRMLAKPGLSQLMQVYLMMEEHLPGRWQWLLPVFGATATGKVPYAQVSRMLKGGLRGSALKVMSRAISMPLP